MRNISEFMVKTLYPSWPEGNSLNRNAFSFKSTPDSVFDISEMQKYRLPFDSPRDYNEAHLFPEILTKRFSKYALKVQVEPENVLILNRETLSHSIL